MSYRQSRPALAAGIRLGPYEVVTALGAGGMGEVYRARDTKLRRDVAIKVLPQSLADDPDRLARFQREAEVLASLNHPNIGGIHSLEESDGARALVMELVEGEDLSQRIARGPVPINEALAIAKQIAGALAAAHEQGVIHRDLKPANIRIRSNGVVKVVDFGLAKTMEPLSFAGAAVFNHPQTMSNPATLSGAGLLLGTAAYMSPEQARGTSLDRRTDIWSFGCVLYEMLAGRAPFTGDTISDTLAAILEREPDRTLLPADTPVPIRILLRRCLEKDREGRLDSAAVARLEIDAVEAPAIEMPALAAIAVLAFTDMSAAKDQGWFCDGIAEEILNALTHSRASGSPRAHRRSLSRARATTFGLSVKS
jgi:serine/threonine protein kinase